MNAFLQSILNHPVSSLLVIGNLIIIESLLSVDNAAVMALMVMDLSKEQRSKSLRYGIVGGYLFRGLALIFATYLMRFWILKVLGGLYLVVLFFDWVRKKRTKKPDEEKGKKGKGKVFHFVSQRIGKFWATVLLVELMDLAFSIDNVFAAVAFTKNVILVWTGVFIGMLAMRFVSQGFVRAMEKYVFLESSAFLVIGVLGVKLMLSLFEHYMPGAKFSLFLGSQAADLATSLLTVLIFCIPLATSWVLKSLSTKNRH
jgi:YkoY family integral membrane protein